MKTGAENAHQRSYELSCGHVVLWSSIPAAGDLVLCVACGYDEVCVMRRADGGRLRPAAAAAGGGTKPALQGTAAGAGPPINVGGSHKRTAAAQGKDTHVNFAELTGKKVFIRAVTHYYTGLLADVSMGSDGTWLHLEDAAWVADTGRFGEALASGKLSEVEPFPGDCWVAAGAVVDVSEWHHDLPRKAV